MLLAVDAQFLAVTQYNALESDDLLAVGGCRAIGIPTATAKYLVRNFLSLLVSGNLPRMFLILPNTHPAIGSGFPGPLRRTSFPTSQPKL